MNDDEVIAQAFSLDHGCGLPFRLSRQDEVDCARRVMHAERCEERKVMVDGMNELHL